MTRKELEKLSAVDLKNVDAKNLVDLKNVNIRKDLPFRERIMNYIQQVKNPYCYISNGVVVKLSFAGTRKLEDCIKDYLAFGTNLSTASSNSRRFYAYSNVDLSREAS